MSSGLSLGKYITSRTEEESSFEAQEELVVFGDGVVVRRWGLRIALAGAVAVRTLGHTRVLVQIRSLHLESAMPGSVPLLIRERGIYSLGPNGPCC